VGKYKITDQNRSRELLEVTLDFFVFEDNKLRPVLKKISGHPEMHNLI